MLQKPMSKKSNQKQNNLLNQNQPLYEYKPSTPTQKVVENRYTAPKQNNINYNTQTNSYLEKANLLIDQLMGNGNIGSGSSSNSGSVKGYYNPEQDPLYQNALKLSEIQANKASKSAMEQMNDRGILNSTITSDRVAAIQQDAQNQALSLMPQFAAQFDQRNQFDRNLNLNLANLLTNTGERRLDRMENARQFDADLGFRYTGLNENARQFDSNLAQRQREHGDNMGYRYATLNENARQFDANDRFRINQSTGYFVDPHTGQRVNSLERDAWTADVTGMYNGQQTEQSKLNWANFGLQEGALTGNYIPWQVRDDVQRLQELKRATATGLVKPGTKKYNDTVNEANSIRDYLYSQGLDISNMQWNTPLAQMQASPYGMDTLSKGELTGTYRGQQTLPLQQMQYDNQYRNRALDADIANTNYRNSLAQQELALSRDRWADERDLKLIELEQSLQRPSNNRLSEAQINENTNIMAEGYIRSPEPLEQSLQRINSNRNDLINRGVDPDKLIQIIKQVKQSGGGTIDYSKLAQG